MNDKKFIITQDETIASKLIAQNFKLISAISNTYIFITQAPEKFSFDEFDVKKVHFTNNLHL